MTKEEELSSQIFELENQIDTLQSELDKLQGNKPKQLGKVLKLVDRDIKYKYNVEKGTGKKTVTCLLECEVELRNLWNVKEELRRFVWNGFDAVGGNGIEVKATARCDANDTYSQAYGERLALAKARAKALFNMANLADKICEQCTDAFEKFNFEAGRYENAAEEQASLVEVISEEGPSKEDLKKDEDRKNEKKD